jgi:hypothetical protein
MPEMYDDPSREVRLACQLPKVVADRRPRSQPAASSASIDGDRLTTIHVIARHAEAAVERPGDGFARALATEAGRHFASPFRPTSREPPEREEPGGTRMGSGLQTIQNKTNPEGFE